MQLELAEFRAATATHIVSLGNVCALAYNLRRHYNFGGAFPCDWWVTSGEGLALFLADPDVDILYDPDRLEVTAGSASVRHRDFDFLLHHEFPRHWQSPGAPVRDDWREHIAEPKSRTAALVAKLVALNAPGARIAFLRNGGIPADLNNQIDRLFPAPAWTIVGLDVTHNASHGWTGDADAWDAALSPLGLTLDRTGHRPFLGEQQGLMGLV